ncbi:MAG: MFS transporter [Alphaproteobacteria bacterium]|nr:MFS transporter [Alphaproteobacteria bacterium]
MTQALSRKQIIVMGAGAGLLAIALGVRQAMGFFLVPMTIDLEWSRELFGLAMAIQNLIWGAFQPIAGGLADRYGSGKVIMGGAALYALGVVGMAGAVTPTELLISGGVLIGLGMSGAGISVVYGAVARLVVPERRTYALAIVSTIGALGPFVLPKVTQVVIGGLGWHWSLLATAVIVALMIPLGGMMRGRAEETGEAAQSWTEALGEARKNRGYLLLVAGFFVCGFHVTFIGTHLPGFVAWCGLAAGVGGTALTVIGGGNILGTYIAGVLSNRFRQKNLLSLIYLARALLIAWLMLMPKTEWTIYIFSGVFGLLWLSTVPLTSGVVAKIFGARHLGMLFGLVFFSHQIGAFLGAWLGGLNFDVTGNYNAVWYVSILLGLLAAALHWPIRDEPVERLLAPQNA